jgi:hypothetical protein
MFREPYGFPVARDKHTYDFILIHQGQIQKGSCLIDRS